MIVLAAPLAGCPQAGRARVAPPAVVQHRTDIRWMPSSVRRYSPLIDDASVRHGVDANLLAVMILVESGGDPFASSPKGAMGLMQIMPGTGQDIARARGVLTHVDARLYDPAYNIDFGAWYIARQIERFWAGDSQRTVERAVGAYNGGPARMARHLSSGEPLPTETLRYQRWVTGMWSERYQPVSPMFGDWWGSGGERLVGRASGPVIF